MTLQERKKAYYKENKEQILAKKREYDCINIEKIKAYQAAYRAKKRSEKEEEIRKKIESIKKQMQSYNILKKTS